MIESGSAVECGLEQSVRARVLQAPSVPLLSEESRRGIHRGGKKEKEAGGRERESQRFYTQDGCCVLCS